jgi:alanyl-tRNA synthetase
MLIKSADTTFLINLLVIVTLMLSISRISSFSIKTFNRAIPHRIKARYLSLSRDDKSIEWPVSRVRSQFIDYFVKKREHVDYKSSPVVPVNDPTLLFTNAGMNQFKPIFLGTADPSSPYFSLKRAVNSQKCIRAGGKHNDLDDVGKDTYHHTFFEMLGTWSFGNYFKQEAIDWAYDILVNEYKLPSERLYASYFGGDEAQGLPADTEARDYWLKYLPKERVLPFDKKANFWEMGDTGPCGPCSEIHFDRIGKRDASALVNADDPNVIEIWNLVFIQFNREKSGELRSLPDKHIDTGMGLERLTSILQQKNSNYDTDVFQPIFDAIHAKVGNAKYNGKLGVEDAQQGYRDTAYRVIADHIRTLTFAMTDGAVPSNEGRGYVLRRILRRAVRYGMQNLNAKPGFFAELVPVVVQAFGEFYPELKDKQQYVMSIISEEEQSFASLVERGIKYFNEVVAELKSTVVPGDQAFYLYDSLGFPIDLTQIMAQEKGLSVDLQGFQAAMDAQKERGRAATRAKRLAGLEALTLGAEQTSYLQKAGVIPTDDSMKYSWDITAEAEVMAVYTTAGFQSSMKRADMLAEDGQPKTIGIILNSTPFYAESGGQIADSGSLLVGSAIFDVVDVQVFGGYVLHICVLSDESIKASSDSNIDLKTKDKVLAQVDYSRRRKIAPNHTMTHVLNYALREVSLLSSTPLTRR